MNGAESLIRTLVKGGVEICFNNPGTSEMHLVAAIDRVDGMRPVLGLFEGVVTGAADGYARMAGKPACTLLHLGPGLGNGLANLHNAKKAGSPVINVIGDHATYHRKYDAPLSSDVRAIATTMSHWVQVAETPADAGRLAAAALAEAKVAPGHVASLILPADSAWGEVPEGHPEPAILPAPRRPEVPQSRLPEVAAALKAARRAVILLGGEGVRRAGLSEAGRIAAATGAELFSETFNQRIERGAGSVPFKILAYFGEQAMAQLEGVDLMVLAGAKTPIAFFAYPGKPSVLVPDGCKVLTLARPEEDAQGALAALAGLLQAPRAPQALVRAERPARPTGRLDANACGQALGALLPEGAIIVDEGCTSGAWSSIHTAGAPAHDWLQLTGGSIGMGLPVAVGTAIARPDRKTVCIHGDGGAMYTVQALWTMARERLDVVTVIFANCSYAILNIELARVGAGNPGPRALSMLDLSNPKLRWTEIARGMGVEATRCETAESFTAALEGALKARGPHLIEAVI